MIEPQVRKIKEWRPFFGGSSSIIMIAGYLEDVDQKKLWKSSAIEYRENPRTLVTKTGGKYILVGCMNKGICFERGFPSNVIEMFTDGFPDDWRGILQTCYDNIIQCKARFATTQNEDIDHDFDFSTPPKASKKAKKETKAVVPYKTTPNTVATTRSGRTVKPRVATWANQSIVYDKDGSVIEVRNPITTTRQSKKVNQNLDKLCNVLGVEAPETSQISEKSLQSLKRKSTEKPKIQKKKAKNNLVGYSDSEYDSIDEESSDGLEILETGDTPIRASKQVRKNIQNRLKALETSSEEDEEIEVRPIKTEKNRKKKTATKSTKNYHAPAKKAKKNEPKPKGLLALKKARDRTRTPSPVDFDDHPIIEYPDSENDKENQKEVPRAPKKWTAKEKERFLSLLKIENPVNDYDWERFQANNKNDRTIEEMKEKAKEFRWKPFQSQSQKQQASDNASIRIDSITARPGTVAHIMQANQANQEYLSAKNKNNAAEDFAQQIRNANYAPINLNDSIMSMLRTPENPRRHRNAFNPSFDINLDVSQANTSASFNDSRASSILSPPNYSTVQNGKTLRTKLINDMKILKKSCSRNVQYGQNSTVFTETIMATTANFIVPQLPINRQKNFLNIEEEYNSEEDEENETENSMLDNSESY